MSRTRSALIVTRVFPPVAAAGVYRTAGLCRYLVERGWRVTVITAAPSKGASLDRQLLETMPREVRVVRTAAPDLPMILARLVKRKKAGGSANTGVGVPSTKGSSQRGTSALRRGLKRLVDWLSWWLHVPDGCTGWLIPALWAGLKEGRRRRPDVVFSSAPVWTAHVVGMALSRMLRVPFVADYRDPWCGSAFRNIPYRSHRYVNRILERMVVGDARRVTCAWDGIRLHLAMNYPRNAGKITTILNGFDPGAIDTAPPICHDAERKVFLHVGAFYGPRSPVPLLEAMQQFGPREDGSNGVVFVLAGPPYYRSQSLQGMVRDYGLQGLVQILPQLPHREAIGLLKGADAAVLFGQSGKESLASVPGKAYEYIAAGKPVLAIGAGKEACDIMRKGGCKVWTASADEPAQIAGAVTDMVQFLDRKPSDDATVSETRSQFTRESMAARLESVLLDVVDNRTTGRLAGRYKRYRYSAAAPEVRQQWR